MRENWKYSYFSEVYPIVMGKTPARADISLWDKKKETHYLWVSIADISVNESKYILDTEEYVSKKAASKMRIVSKGSLLMSFKLTIGKMAFAGDDLFTNEAIIAIPDNGKYNLRFLYYYLSNYNWSTLTDGAEKVKGKTLNKTSIGKILLPILSLPEQARIVSYLDAQFAKIDALKANAASQLQAAKDLFQSALKEMLTPKEGWEEKKLGEIVNIKRGLTYSKNDEVETSEKIVLRSNNVNLDNHQFDFTELKYLTPSFDIPADKYLQKGDLLMCMSNGSKAHLGKVALYDGESDKYAFGGFMAALSHKDSVIGRYLFYAMITPMYKEYIKTLSDGANINNLKVRDIESYSISFPSLPEQERIAARLDAISEKVKALQANYDQTINLCNDLKQSLLKSIFA